MKSVIKKLNVALDKVELFYALGQYQQDPNEVKSQKTRSALSSGLKTLNEETRRKVMQFANPKIGYSESELDTLLRMCRDSNFPIGYSLVIRLLAVPKQDRVSVQKRVIQQRMKRRDLDNYISSKYGARRQGGRKPKKYKSTDEALAGLRSMCLAWINTAESLTSIDAVQRRIIPRALLKDYQLLTEQMNKFYKRVNRAQKRLRPKKT